MHGYSKRTFGDCSAGFFLHAGRTSCHLTNNVKALKEEKHQDALHNLQKLKSFDEVVDVVAERFQRRVRPFVPHLRQFADEKAIGQGFEVFGHHQQALESFLQTRQARSDDVR